MSVDQWGFIESACTKVPAPPTTSMPAVNGIVTDDEIAWTRAIILANAELFGIDDPASFDLQPAESYIRSQSSEPYLSRRMARATQQVGVWPLTLDPHRTWLTLYEQPLQVGRKTPGVRTGQETFCITGHFWPEAYLPDAPLVSREDIEAAALRVLSGQRVAVDARPQRHAEALPPHPRGPRLHALCVVAMATTQTCRSCLY